MLSCELNNVRITTFGYVRPRHGLPATKLRLYESSIFAEIKRIKIRLFQATVKSILLYGTELWTITEFLKKRIDGCYRRMLRMALNVDLREHRTNKEVFESLPRVSSKIQARRIRLAGYIQRHDDLAAHQLLLWEPSHGTRGRGRPPLTFVDNLRSDTEFKNTGEIKKLMADRN